MVSAAGWLLGYPVVYTFGDEQPKIRVSHNDSWNLDLWESDIESPTDLSLYLVEAQLLLPPTLAQCIQCPLHSVLAFSIPCELHDADHIVDKASCSVRQRLLEGLQSSEFWNDAELKINVNPVHMDRIAL